MITPYEAWQAVEKRAPAPRKQKLGKLRSLLGELDNPHAEMLSDRTPHAPCDRASAEALEAWLVSQHLSSKIDKFEIAEWLRLCYDVIKEFNQNGANLYQTRLADIARPETSPFSLISVDRQRSVDPWRQVLYDWIAADAKSSEEWIAAIAISAVLHGALLDSTRLSALVAMLNNKELPIFEKRASYVLFNLPYQGLGNHNLQRWFMDPITEMLVWRYADLKCDPTKLKPMALIKKFLSTRIHENFIPASLGDFLSTATSWWSMRASPIDIHCATRGITWHSVNDRSWSRVHEFDFATDIEQTTALNDAEGPVDIGFDVDDLLLLNPWLADSIQALTLPTRQETTLAIRTLRESEPKDGIAALFLSWLCELLDGLSSTRSVLEISTIARRYEIAAPLLLSSFRGEDARQMDIYDLEDCYSDLMSDPNPLIPRSVLAAGIRDFHAYLHRHYGKPFISSEREVFGERLALKPVDGSIVTFDEYRKAHRWIDKSVGSIRDKLASKIILTMAFKLGMRRMEIFGLLLSDLQLLCRATCLIQKNDRRRIKTNSSKRVLPLRAFLSKAEMNMLMDWIDIYRDPSSNDKAPGVDPYFFPGFTGNPDQFWTKKITHLAIEAIRTVTGDDQLYLHHLRHSFATWTYLRLRAPDFPDLHTFFEGHPDTVFALNTGRRLRVLLYNRDPGASRTYAYAVSRLLGHSSPLSSFGHYIHSSDLILGAVTSREADRLPNGIPLAASGLQKSAAYANHQQSLAQLLHASRVKFMPDSARRAKNKPKARSKGRPRRPPVHESTDWFALDSVGQILENAINNGKAASVISMEFGVSLDFVESIVRKATAFGVQMGLNTDANGSILEIPLKVHKQEPGREYCKELERRLADMSKRAPILYTKGIELYLNHYDHEKKDVVFRGEKERPAAIQFLKFLASLGCEGEEFSWVLRTVEPLNPQLPAWATQLKANWSPKSSKAIKPKKASSASSYAKWIGILPVLKDGTSLGLPVARTVFLASLTASTIATK